MLASGLNTFSRLEQLKEDAPKVSRIAGIKVEATDARKWKCLSTEVAARSLGVRIQVVETRGPCRFREGLFGNDQRADVLTVLPTLLLSTERRLIDRRQRTGCRQRILRGSVSMQGTNVLMERTWLICIGARTR